MNDLHVLANVVAYTPAQLGTCIGLAFVVGLCFGMWVRGSK